MFTEIGLVDFTAFFTPTITYAGINNVTIKDNDSYYDKDRMVSVVLTDEEIQGYKKTDTYTWNENTVYLFNYNENLQGGSISIPVDDIQRVLLYRTNVSSPSDSILLRSDLSASDLSVIDYKAANNNTYTYSLVFIDSTGKTSNIFTSNEVTSCYNSVFVIDPTEGVSFRFNCNTNSIKVSKKDSRTFIESEFSQYPITETGDTYYAEGNVSCLLGYIDDDGNYIDNVKYRKILEDILRNDNVKIIKDRGGDVYLAQTSVFSHSANSQTSEKEQTISFSFKEVYDIDGIEL